MVGLKHIYSLLVLGVVCFFGNAQDCTLDIGGKSSETIIKIFQLNEEQIGKMESWSAQLNTETSLIEDQIKLLLDEHPQETPDDLALLAKKYNTLKEQIVNTSKEYDKKLIALFNERQYQRYSDLCHAAFRKPIMVNPE
ncbi:MAG: hypothetical protein WBG90_19175 [Saonia sp.]